MGGCLEIPYRVNTEGTFFIFSDLATFRITEECEVSIMLQTETIITVDVDRIASIGLIADRVLDELRKAVAVKKRINT